MYEIRTSANAEDWRKVSGKEIMFILSIFNFFKLSAQEFWEWFWELSAKGKIIFILIVLLVFSTIFGAWQYRRLRVRLNTQISVEKEARSEQSQIELNNLEEKQVEIETQKTDIQNANLSNMTNDELRNELIEEARKAKERRK